VTARIDVSRIPRRRPGRPPTPLPEAAPVAVPLAAPPWIDTDAEREARRARLVREVAAFDGARRWDRAITAGLREIGGAA
jgi:hypothetical protein